MMPILTKYFLPAPAKTRAVIHNHFDEVSGMVREREHAKVEKEMEGYLKALNIK